MLGVDFDPDVIRDWGHSGASVMYGDLFDPDMHESLPLGTARYIIIAVPPHEIGVTHEDPRLALVEAVRGRGFGGHIAAIASSDADGAMLRSKGVDTTLRPFSDAAERAIEKLFGTPEADVG